MRNFIAKANQKISVGWAATLLASTTLISSLLGLLRERLLLANFGVSEEVDAYKAAFAVPDFMFFLLVSGALSVTFIPVFTERLIKGNRESAWQLSSSVLNFLALITGAVSIFLIIFADPLVRHVVAPGLSEYSTGLAILMMRVIALNPFLFAISSVLTSMQQALGRFFFYALAPSLYNIGIIFGIMYLSPRYGIEGVAYGVLIGSILQLLASFMGMIGTNYKYTGGISWRNLGFRRVLELLPARSADQGIDYLNTLVEVNIASRLREGAITAYQTAFTLHMVPITLIGVAISTAAFPKMSERLSQGRPDLFKKEMVAILRVIIWLALPAGIIAFFGRGYLVRLLVADGNKTIATLLGLLVIAVLFRSVFHLISRTYYAQQDTKTPLLISIAAITLNIALAIYLTRQARYGIFGLAMAQSITAIFEVVVLFIVMSRRLPGLLDMKFIRGVTAMISAAGLSGLFTYVLVAFLLPLQATDVGFFTLAPKFGLIVLGSLGSYIVISYMFGIKESRPVMERVGNVVFKPIRTLKIE
ncbi:MAG: murein biosynthesis integral membrane protein MurJ [Candidatus Saccharimonadales bacterium]|nr:murein biosynthesis integral membrane protein MurJ [Candidatus Saccharimonadales bacterium]